MTHLQTFRSRFNVVARFKTADDIADFFRRKGIKGQEDSYYSCPVANYVKICGDHYTQVQVHADQVTAYFPGPERSGDGRFYDLPTTAAMSRFIKNFDAGKYTDLRNAE